MQYDPKVIGAVIKRLRRKRGWTQEVASGFATLGRPHYASIECGKTAEIDTLSKIAAAYDLRLSELFRLVEEELDKNEHA